jgi:nucleoid DNA-binding protein
MDMRAFYRRVSARTGQPMDVIQRVFYGVIDEGKELLREGDQFRLPGFGSFQIRILHPRQWQDRFALGRGEKPKPYMLAERKRINFTSYDSLNSYVNLSDQEVEGWEEKPRPILVDDGDDGDEEDDE